MRVLQSKIGTSAHLKSVGNLQTGEAAPPRLIGPGVGDLSTDYCLLVIYQMKSVHFSFDL